MKHATLSLLLIVVLSLFVAACGAAPAPEPTATPTVEPTAVPTPEPTNTPETPETDPADKPEVVTSFDASRSELPEGIAIDKAGNIYVSLGPPLFVGGGFGEIWKISPEGTATTLAQFDGGPPAAGLVVDADANLYYAYPSGEEETQGVYRLTPDGDSERLPGTEAIINANGLAFDNDGNLFVGDSIPGAIWRIPPGGSAEPWLQHDLLTGCMPDDPFGTNGVAVGDGNIYAANTGKGILVSVPILADGSAGEPELVAGTGDCDAEVKELYGMDGIALDAEGNVYAMLVLQNKLVKIDPSDGSFSTLLTGDDGLHNPASITFGSGEDNQSILFTNYAVLPPEPATSPGPAVLKFDVGVPGEPAIMPEIAQADSADKPEVVTSFDASRSELPEGVAIDKAGNIYVSLGPPLFVGGGFGEIWKISPDGAETTLAQFDGGPPAAGLAVDADANLYYAYPSGEEDTQGVYRLSADGDSERLPGTEAIINANGLAFDNDGNLFVGDSIPGAIWRIPPGGSAEPWLQHDLLTGCMPDDPFGANGVAVGDGNIYAANTGKGILVSIPILSDGSAGEPELVAGAADCDAEVKELYGMDGIALDTEGNVYAMLVLQNKLVKIDPADGTFTTLLTADDGLHNPASITFGSGEDNRSILFTNYAVLPPEPATSPGPAVLKFYVGVLGEPAIMPEIAQADSADKPEVVTSFDASRSELSEGVAASYSGDDGYDSAAGGTPNLSVVALPGRSAPAIVANYSGDDDYDPAADDHSELSVIALSD